MSRDSIVMQLAALHRRTLDRDPDAFFNGIEDKQFFLQLIEGAKEKLRDEGAEAFTAYVQGRLRTARGFEVDLVCSLVGRLYDFVGLDENRAVWGDFAPFLNIE